MVNGQDGHRDVWAGYVYGLPQYARSAGNTGWQRVGWVGPSTVSAAARQTA
jgi:hypothetical protein